MESFVTMVAKDKYFLFECFLPFGCDEYKTFYVIHYRRMHKKYGINFKIENKLFHWLGNFQNRTLLDFIRYVETF